MGKKHIACVLVILLTMSLLSGCGSIAVSTERTELAAGVSGPVSTAVTESGVSFSDDEIAIELSDSGSRCEDSSVLINGSTVTITSAGDYVLTGSLSDGQILIKAPDDAKVKLILNGVSIIKKGHAAIYAVNADKLVLFSTEGSENLLQSTGDFVQSDEDKVDAAVFARCDLTLSGDGILNISCLTGHAVVSKDDLKLRSGTVNLEAACKGLYGKDSVTIVGGTLNADVGTDGLYAANSEDSEKGTVTIEGGILNLLCQKDGVDASGDIRIDGGTLTISAGSNQEGKGIKSDADITVSGGCVTVSSVDDAIHASGSVELSGGDLLLSTGDDGVHADDTLAVSGGCVTVNQSYEGMEAQVIIVSGGTIRVNARDDGFNAAGGKDSSNDMGFFGGDPFLTDSDASLTISGGTIHVNAEGDGLDSNGYLYMSGGEVYVSGPTDSANGALDYGFDAVISGGTIVAVGAAGMAENFGQNSSQGSILVNLSSLQPAGSKVYLLDETGTVLASYEPEKSYTSVVISTPGLSVGEDYIILAGDEEMEVSLIDLIYGSGAFMGGMGPGGFNGFGNSSGRPESQIPGGFPQGNLPPDGFPEGIPQGGLSEGGSRPGWNSASDLS